jgi:two-component system sensor histidine kinase KdpD
VLDVSRLESDSLRPELEWVSIVDVVADVLDRMEPILTEVDNELSEGLPPTPTDFVQISQVVTNLVDNALRYSAPDASITISGEVVHGQLRVTVFNQGSFLATEELDRVFDRLYRLSTVSGGVGLGPPIARETVAAHGGRIWAENVGTRGVAFTFVMPSPPQPGVQARGVPQRGRPAPI